MTSKRTESAGERKTKKLKVKKETLRDLDASKKARKVKGGLKPPKPPATYGFGCRTYGIGC